MLFGRFSAYCTNKPYRGYRQPICRKVKKFVHLELVYTFQHTRQTIAVQLPNVIFHIKQAQKHDIPDFSAYGHPPVTFLGLSVLKDSLVKGKKCEKTCPPFFKLTF